MYLSKLFLTLSIAAASIANADSGLGVGPIKSLKLDSKIDAKMVELGKKTFKMKCSQCHKIDKKYTGPQLLAVTKRRKPEWIMNMILNPLEMTAKDPTAKAMKAKLLTQMANQNIGEVNARAILEFFRDNDKNLTPDQIKAVIDHSL